MKKYIGGEFGRYPIRKSNSPIVRYDNTLFVMSGRTAMYAIMQDIALKHIISSVYLPSYCSRSMIKPIIDSGINVTFYDIIIGKDGLDISYDANHRCDCMLMMDYFGFCNPKIRDIAIYEHSKGTIIIIDATQALLCGQQYKEFADYLLVSFRKWFASNAALAYSKTGFIQSKKYTVNTKYEDLRNEGFLKVQEEGFCKDVLDDSEEILLSDYQNHKPSDEEIEYLTSLDYEGIRRKRIENAKRLIYELQSIDRIKLLYDKIKEPDCPLYVPIIIDPLLDRNYVVHELLKECIECYVHWGFSKYHNETYRNHVLYKNEISLFCDQRYDAEDMKRIAQSLRKVIAQYEENS